MGCGQSKINLYPRRNKNGSKGNGARKSGSVEKESDEEEGSAGTGSQPDDDDPERSKQTLPLVPHPPTIEVSESQQDFFRMLDERVEQGRDYDSSSETEIRIEQERRRILLEQWPTPAQPQPSPLNPARRRGRQYTQSLERQGSPAGTRRCCRQLPDGASPPPPRRPLSAHSHHPEQRYASNEWTKDEQRSPTKRPLHHSPNWKNQTKQPCSQKSKRCDVNENQRTVHNDANSSHEAVSQQYDSAFQSRQQPYMAQTINAYPMSQQLSPPATPKYIAPPEEYQDPQDDVQDQKYETRQTTTTISQPPIYMIHGNSNQNLAQDIAQQRQQTALHLQQYVAMKQAQQQMFTYFQRGPHTVFPNVDYSQIDPAKVHEYEEFYSHSATSATTLRPHSAPTAAAGPVRPIPVLPGYGAVDAAHMPQAPMWTPMPAVVSNVGPWAAGHIGQDLAYYPQSQYVQNMYRPNSAGSAGTLTRYKDKRCDDAKGNLCQINIVRQKPVGQIVMGAQELTVCTNSSDSASPASVSTDSGVSPGNSLPKNTVFPPPAPTPTFHDTTNHTNNAVEVKNKKNKSGPFSRSLKNSKSLDSS